MTGRQLILVRHGESTANVAREAAEAGGYEQVEMRCRDVDVTLSARGRAQAEATGRRLATLLSDVGPIQLWTSPYARARSSAELAAAAAGLTDAARPDERLRDRELGILDTLTALGVRIRYPLEAERRRWLGEFYYRPPGGESWADLALRLRSFLTGLRRSEPGSTICLFTHDAVIAVCRYVCEGLDEHTILELAAQEPIANASISRLIRLESEDRWQVAEYNVQSHLVDVDGQDLRTDVHRR